VHLGTRCCVTALWIRCSQPRAGRVVQSVVETKHTLFGKGNAHGIQKERREHERSSSAQEGCEATKHGKSWRIRGYTEVRL
jgi:hypothetical protein